MSLDTVAALQRMQQLKQSEAASGEKLILKREDSKTEKTVLILGIVLALPTIGLSLLFMVLYGLTNERNRKTYLVKNIATGERFHVDKEDFKQYEKEFKAKEKEVRKISDLK